MATLKTIKNKYLQVSDGDALGVTTNTENISLLSFKLATADSISKFNLVDGFSDDYQDATGIDASGSTNEIRDSSAKYYSGSSSVAATGGTITTDGNFTVHSFSANANYVTDTAQTIDYLIVGGGGGGGAGNSGPGDPGGFRAGGAGGAGGYRSFTGVSLAAGTFAVVVGAGGAGGPGSASGVARDGSDGGVSSFNSQTSAGGGGGGGASGGSVRDGHNGASGGGGSATLGTGVGGTGNTPSTSPAQGNNGRGGASNEGGGGGGSSAAAGTGPSPVRSGGAGTANSITGSSVTYAGGGSGGSGSVTPGGSGGGGNGGSENQTGGAGTDGLGGGGGGGGSSESGTQVTGGAAGDGVVIIRRPTGTQYLNMTLQSNAFTAQAVPTTARIVLDEHTSTGSATLNTDIKAYASRDNGTTYTQITLANQGTIETNHRLLSGSVDISGQPSGTSVKYKIETLNQSDSKITRLHSTSMAWA